MPGRITLVLDTAVFEKHKTRKDALNKTWEEYFLNAVEGFYGD